MLSENALRNEMRDNHAFMLAATCAGLQYAERTLGRFPASGMTPSDPSGPWLAPRPHRAISCASGAVCSVEATRPLQARYAVSGQYDTKCMSSAISAAAPQTLCDWHAHATPRSALCSTHQCCHSALHGCDMPPWCIRDIRGSRQRGVPTRRSNVLRCYKCSAPPNARALCVSPPRSHPSLQAHIHAH